MAEEVPVEVLQADEMISRVYRMSEMFQVFLYLILAIGGSAGIYYATRYILDPSLLIEIILFYLAVLFPLIVKVQSAYRYAFGFGLRLASIGGLVIIIVEQYGIASRSLRGLFIVTVTILIFELYQHLIGIYPKNKAYLALIYGISAIVFFGAMLLAVIDYTSLPVALGISFIMTLIFIRAVLPERKI